MANLTSDAKRMRTIIISFPVLVVTSAILYRRIYYGEEQRRVPRPTELPQQQTEQPTERTRVFPSKLGGSPFISDEEASKR